MTNLLGEKLKCNLESAAAEFNGVLGVSVKDVVSSEEFNVNEGEIFPVGSSIKIPILIELFRKAKAGTVDLDETITVHEKDKARGSGVLKELGNGTVSMTLLDLATLMIIVSDNTATNMLIDAIKMAEVNAMIKRLGLKEMKLQRKMLDYVAASKGLENLSTPKEFMRMMDILYTKNGLDPWACEQTLAILKKPKMGTIARGLPLGIELANKPGGIEGVSCDVGIVYQPNRPYIIVLMAKNIPPSDAKKLRATEQMSQVSSMVYEYFSTKSTATTYGRNIPEEELRNKIF